MKFLKHLPNIISIFLSCLVIAGLYLAFRWVNRQLNDNIPDMNYQTVFLKDTIIIKEPDTKVKWLEKIKQVEAKPETVRVVKYDYATPKELVNYIKADGRKIRIRTQMWGMDIGTEYTYPYYKYFQFVPGTTPSMIYYKDFWDWDRLNISVCYDMINGNTDIKVYSSLQFNPWGLMIQPYVSTKGTGIEIRKKLW